LTKKAKFNDENLISKVYLYYDKATKKVVGFITLSNYLLRLSDAKEFGIQKVPAALIGRIAIDNEYRGYNLEGLVERSKLEFLTGTKSLPIESKSSKKIAIKVIYYRGNELLSVFKLNENE